MYFPRTKGSKSERLYSERSSPAATVLTFLIELPFCPRRGRALTIRMTSSQCTCATTSRRPEDETPNVTKRLSSRERSGSSPAVHAQTRAGRGGANRVTVPGAPAREYGVYHFRRTFDPAEKPASFVLNESADNRYKLYGNGEEAAVGPARGDRWDWRYDHVDFVRYLRAAAR
jgi:hypothetical protein